MKTLSHEAFQRARTFLKTHARPLERALFEYHFESGSEERVFDELDTFQNHDGGFGHGLEPDYRMPDSSPIATVYAFQVFRQIGASAGDAMVFNAIRYLLGAYDQQLGTWVMPAEVNNYPRAPWFTVTEPPRAGFRFVPDAEIVGCLHEYASLVSYDFLKTVMKHAVSAVHAAPDAMDVFDFLSVLQMSETLPEPEKSTVLEKLRRGVRQVAVPSSEWKGTLAKPLWFASRPNAPLADLLEQELSPNLDFEIESQGEDGAWEPFWTWDKYPEEAKKARREWKGWLTLKNLLTFRNFGRIEG